MTKNMKKLDDIQKLVLKLEAAEELGLTKKIKKEGWGGLTAEETGKLGGYITKKINESKNNEKNDSM